MRLSDYSYSQSKPEFPPENIIQDRKNQFIDVVLAVAGFKKENIKIEIEDEFLIVEGSLNQAPFDEANLILVKENLRSNSFKRKYAFPDNYFDFRNPKVTLQDGILTIHIEKNPDFVSPKKQITIE